MDKKPRKKFRDTKVGQFLKEKSPKILDVVGDILPDSGALGIAKNLINMADDLTQEEFLSMDTNLKTFSDIIGACERIKNTPLPYSYSNLPNPAVS